MRRLAIALALPISGEACRPEFNEDEALVTTARVLAVKSEPAEVKPGAPLLFTGFVALPPSSPEPATLVWRFCVAPKPPTVDNVVAPACLDSASLQPAGEGFTIMAATPSAACTLFGPNVAASGFRPRDPDVTGGYFQPLRVDLKGADPVFHLQRLECGLAGAPADIASAFGHEYVPNQNPHLEPLLATIAGEQAELRQIPAGAAVEFTVSWAAAEAESYAYFDRAAQAIRTRRESMRVTWHASAGKLNTESSGRAEGDPGLSSSNVWTAPSTAGSARLWIVLGDSRGGVDFVAQDLEVIR